MIFSAFQDEASRSRSSSVAAMFVPPGKSRNKSALSVVTRAEASNHEEAWINKHDTMSPKKSKKNAFAEFFREWGNSRTANKVFHECLNFRIVDVVDQFLIFEMRKLAIRRRVESGPIFDRGKTIISQEGS